jgi:type IX secretion system PorP/SprF family membrane protein
MNKLKSLIAVIFFSIITIVSQAQQDMTFSMYMFNPTFVNPAAAGYLDRPQLSAIFRYQWVGIEGAPRSGNVSFHSPLKNPNMALGGTLKYDKLGLFNNIGLDLNYAYRLKLDENTRLSLGLMGSLFMINDGASKANLNDPSEITSSATAFLPNFGAGVYLMNKRYFVGASVPHLLNLRIADIRLDSAVTTASKIYNHYFASAGYVFGKEDGLKIKPQMFFKLSSNSSPNIDINLNFLIKERFWIGAGFRSGGDVITEVGQYNQFAGFRGEAIIGIFKMMVTNKMEVGYAYDYHLSRLRQATSGSHELYLGMYFSGNKKDRFVSPRYVNYF